MFRVSANAGDLDRVHAVARDRLVRAGAGSTREVRVAIYEPEWRKFGGRFCLEHMHELFCLASRQALEALLAADPSRRTRLRIALSFMIALSDALDVSTERYWRFASWYWSGGPTAHAERSRTAIARMAPPNTLFTPSQVEADRAVAYSRAARAILQSVIAAPDAVAGAEHYAFHVIHLMNNRLGVRVIEEAWLSHFLAARAASTGPATLAIDPAEPVGLGAVS
jgi:thiopeptide-type bacteriocin biosynthesis protein